MHKSELEDGSDETHKRKAHRPTLSLRALRNKREAEAGKELRRCKTNDNESETTMDRMAQSAHDYVINGYGLTNQQGRDLVQWYEDKQRALEAHVAAQAAPESYIDVLFDDGPGPTTGRFVECEVKGGLSVNAGEWIERTDGYWALRVTGESLARASRAAVSA